LADIAANTGRTANAQQFYRRAETTGINVLQGKRKSREMAKLYCEWGDFLLRENREKDALRMYQKALVQAYPKFDNLDPVTNPDPGDTPLELWAMIAPARKADLLLRNPTPLARASAADCFDRAFAAAKRLRLAYETDESKLYFTRHNYDLRRNAVLNLWTWYRQTSNPTLLPRLFDLLENGRANALRDALQQQRALALTGIPDSLLHLEKELRGERAAAQTRLLEKEGIGDSVVFSRLQTALFLIELRYRDLLTFLNKNYPRFREYNQAGETANLQVIQNAMPREAVLLTFFDAGDRYLCLVLRKNTLAAYEVLRDSALNQVLARFPVLLADKQRQEAAPSDVYADAFFLKQRLLPDSVLADARSLIVVPDGLLAYLPFEALLTKPHTGSYSMAPYLLRTHSVQYAWSAALLAQEHAPGQSEKSLLQMAPFATATRTGFVALPNSLHEIPENVVADMQTDNEAGVDDFLQLAAHYDVLHLSTHAYAGQRSQPGIEFHDRTLALPEIYAQRLNANLVALSACETNAGAFAEGEGVLSLARAFAYAGARSLVAGYWSVNDRSTAQLFEAFYRHLKNGLPKSEALRRAKLDLLEASGPDARKAPYHWAAFTLTGMDGPVLLEEKKWSWWIFGLAAVGLAGVGLFFLRKRGRR
jgi:CHAT domain-containing protein